MLSLRYRVSSLKGGESDPLADLGEPLKEMEASKTLPGNTDTDRNLFGELLHAGK